MVFNMVMMREGLLGLCLTLALLTYCHSYPARPGISGQASDREENAKSAVKGGRRLFWTVPAPDDYQGSPLDKNDGMLSFLITIWSKRAAKRHNLQGQDLKLFENQGERPIYDEEDEENETDTNQILEEKESQVMKRGLGKLANLVSFGAKSPLSYQRSMFPSSDRGYGVSSRSGSPPMIRSGRKIMKSMGLLSNVMSHLRNFAPPNSQRSFIG